MFLGQPKLGRKSNKKKTQWSVHGATTGRIKNISKINRLMKRRKKFEKNFAFRSKLVSGCDSVMTTYTNR